MRLPVFEVYRQMIIKPMSYSRQCGICYTASPATRAVLSACGHSIYKAYASPGMPMDATVTYTVV
ncbi:hypothetical protein PRIPAC_92216 [Pristionchus pacificus]|uniref:Uncharacterized protein n=1 Tax=Pristionchus pacificus TaxID=54126 RepID=A0A2A6CDN5_PRIPA|nr:hypothetical protein PRIPAC_92216 [Pristionchus pacificus]|eukprot:PDM76355.1 hypothetical protein PRIPAC_39959 [Pristionchus pacificus]